jgi:adenylate cyclase
MEQVNDRSHSEFPIHQGSTHTPAINRQPPSANAAPPWANSTLDGRQTASSVFGGYFDESTDNLGGQVSPGCAPPGGMGFPGDGEDRRPSIASATTISSQGSRGSMGGKFTKKLQGFFGEEIANDPSSKRYGYSRQNSETSSLKNPPPGYGSSSSRNRNNSMNDAMLRGSGAGSPTNSRPRTPSHPPSSEVTPWVYQDPQVRSWMGEVNLIQEVAANSLAGGSEQDFRANRAEQEQVAQAFHWRP